MASHVPNDTLSPGSPSRVQGIGEIRCTGRLVYAACWRDRARRAPTAWRLPSAALNAESIRKLFDQVRKGRLSPDEAVERLRHLPFEDLGFAKVDHHRALRVGMPEVVFGPGKTPAQMAQIFSRLAKQGGNVLATRVSEQQFAAVKKRVAGAEYRGLARAIVLLGDKKKYGKGTIAVVSAGTSDIPVAEEAVVTAEVMGNDVSHIYDVGVAGIHRLLSNREALMRARVVIVCAGIEGPLPSSWVAGGGSGTRCRPASDMARRSGPGGTSRDGRLCTSNVSVVISTTDLGRGMWPH